MILEKREYLIQLFDKYKNFLTLTQKQIFHLHLIEDLSLREVADIQASTRQAVKDAMNKAEKKLLDVESKINIEKE